jgi:putative ABC transport system permease protein
MRVYRLLARIFPKEFRRQYADELESAANDLMRAEGARGPMHRARLWIGLWIDAIKRGLAERRAERHSPIVRPIAAEWRQAVRALAARPGFAAIIIGLLGLVMGANSAVFGVVDATLLRPLPFNDPDRLVMLWERYDPMHLDTMPWSDGDYLSLRSATSFDGTAIFKTRSFVLTGVGEPAGVRAIVVEGGLFDLVGTTAERGRLFTAADSGGHSDDLVVLSHRAWVDRFNSAPDVVGRTVQLDNKPMKIIGVLRAGVAFPPPITFTGQMLTSEPDLYVPYTINTAPEARGAHGSFAIGRLRRGVDAAAAGAELTALASRLEQQFPDTNLGIQMRVMPLHGQAVETIRRVLFVLLSAVGGVLLIACASISNLLLVRASARTREMALRTALGASRASIVRQLLMESAILSVAGAAAGALSARWISRALLALNPIDLPDMFQSSVDLRVLGFTIATTLAAVFAFGLVPALAGSRIDLVGLLRGGTRTTGAPSERRARAALVVIQVALAVVLLVGSGLMIRSLVRLWQVDPGFRPDGVTAVALKLPAVRYADAASRASFTDRWLRRVREIPGVSGVATSTRLPFMFDKSSSDYTIVGEAKRKTGDYLIAGYTFISPGFTSVLHVPVIEGRAFADGDTADAPLVILVSASLARRHWPDGAAIGHQLMFGSDANEKPKTIVGVVGDVHMDGFDGRVEPTIFVPLAQSPSPEFWTIVSSSRPTDALAGDLRQAMKDVDAGLPTGRVRSLIDVMGDTVKKPRFAAVILSAFALTALIIAALGLYGVLTFDVAQQRRELGVRIALGATPGSIRGLVLTRAVRLVAAGLAAGALAAVVCSRLIAGLLFEAPALDLVALSAAIGLLAVTAGLAVWLPARRATRANPIEALRAE